MFSCLIPYLKGGNIAAIYVAICAPNYSFVTKYTMVINVNQVSGRILLAMMIDLYQWAGDFQLWYQLGLSRGYSL
jgi:hypothetical protein